jgi:hypothetical protein
MLHNKTEAVVIWWWLRWHKKRGNGNRRHWMYPLFHENLSSGASIVLKKLNQDPEHL